MNSHPYAPQKPSKKYKIPEPTNFKVKNLYEDMEQKSIEPRVTYAERVALSNGANPIGLPQPQRSGCTITCAQTDGQTGRHFRGFFKINFDREQLEKK